MEIQLQRLRLAALTLISTFLLNPSSSVGQGALTPPGAPAPTMKSLAQIEPRIPISAAPFTITQSGSYYLTTNLVCTVSNAIVIASSGVTLDLGGWTISSTVSNAASGGTAILLAGTPAVTLSDITIFNGHIRGGVTNNGSGAYSGGGFNSGIYYSPSAPQNALVSHVSVSGCLLHGIRLGVGDATVAEACTVRTIGASGFGIQASTIKQSVAVDCGFHAIYGDQVSDCRGESSGNGTGIYAASNAQNSHGESNSGYGVYAVVVAAGCYGSSVSGTGLYSYNASFCTAYRSAGTAINAVVANGCYAYGGTNLITYKYNMP